MQSRFRNYLQDELAGRCRRNPNYSLRSFAKALGISPASLSQILSGKRPITERSRILLGSALGLSDDRLRALDRRTEENSDFQQIALDEFAAISDWYYYAILELTHTRGFRSDAAWIARCLGITKSEVNNAVERLVRLELLDVDKRPWKDLSDSGKMTHLTKGMTSTAARKYQVQLLELSKAAVQEIALSNRSHTSATFAFDVDDIESAIERLNEFRRSFAREFQPRKKGGQVYQLQISFFPLTKCQKES